MATRAPDYTLHGESGDRERYLVLAHQAGDPFAFTEIVRDQYSALYAHAIRRMGDQRAAEDVVQDALLRAYKGLDKFSGDYKLTAWLHRIVDNVCSDEGSRRQRDAKLAERWGLYADVSAPAADEDFVDDHAAATVRSAVASLPDSYREALVLRDVMDMEYADVAEQIGISEQNARARVSRARAALRKMVAPTAPVWVFVVRAARRRTLTATRIAAKLTSQLTGAVGQATTSVTQATAAAASAPPDVLTAPARLAPAISTLAVTAVAAVASVGIPAFVTSTRPSPAPPPAVSHFVQVVSGPAPTDPAATVVVKSVVRAAVAPSTTTTSPSSSTSTTSSTMASAGASVSKPTAAPIPAQAGTPLPPSQLLGTLLTVEPFGSQQQVVGTARLAWPGQARIGHLEAYLNPARMECRSYFGGTLAWLENPTPAIQGYVSFGGWLTSQSTTATGTTYQFVGTMTATGPGTFDGSGWLSGTLTIDKAGVSLDASGWGPGQGAAPLGPTVCPTTTAPALSPPAQRSAMPTTSTASVSTTSILAATATTRTP